MDKELDKIQGDLNSFQTEVDKIISQSQNVYKVLADKEDDTKFQVLENDKPIHLTEYTLLSMETFFKILGGISNAQNKQG